MKIAEESLVTCTLTGNTYFSVVVAQVFWRHAALAANECTPAIDPSIEMPALPEENTDDDGDRLKQGDVAITLERSKESAHATPDAILKENEMVAVAGKSREDGVEGSSEATSSLALAHEKRLDDVDLRKLCGGDNVGDVIVDVAEEAVAQSNDSDSTLLPSTLAPLSLSVTVPRPGIDNGGMKQADTSGSATLHSRDYRAMAIRARAVAKLDRLSAGTKSVFEAKMSDIGALGIGLQLYFMLTKYLGITFTIMGIFSLPAIIVNTYGHGITNQMADPLQLGYASLGNLGVNPEFANDPNMCLPIGDIDCNGTTVNTPFTSSPTRLSWIITISDCLYSLVFLFFILFYRYRARKAIELHLNENLTPAKYAVYVRGLPRDATEQEIHAHFNELYDLSKREASFPLWFGCCWGRRRRKVHASRSLSRHAANHNPVQNLEHLDGTTSVTKDMYLGTWIAEVSIGHPTGGLLKTFLSMEALTQSIAETRTLVNNLEEEKEQAHNGRLLFRPRDEKLLQSSTKKLQKMCKELEKKKSKIKALKHASSSLRKIEQDAEKKQQQLIKSQNATKSKNGSKIASAKVTAVAKAAKTAATATRQPFDWEACECAFVVFNNIESRRRCLHDYRMCTHWLTHWFQPRELRFRDSQYRLVVTPAPEPSNILWENLEVTERGRFYRRSLTNLVTFFLLLITAGIISGAQSAQQQIANEMPPAKLCDRSLPVVFYGNSSYKGSSSSYTAIKWNLVWEKEQVCTPDAYGRARFHVAYDNNIINPLEITHLTPEAAASPPQVTRCTDPCVSENSDMTCNTIPCFDRDMLESGEGTCETYRARHVLYCFCTDALATSVASYGLVSGPKRVWEETTPCRGYITSYLKKNGLLIAAAVVVVLVNVCLNMILRGFAAFERHSSESAKASAIAVKMFLGQFLNTAIIVLLVNASLGLDQVPILGELLKGKFRDFERNWYPTVGVGVATTMLVNSLVPQLLLFLRMFIIGPVTRCLSRRSIRTQDKMNKLYAGPPFDISGRYPMVLNSVFVTLVFCGGSPVLLFIAAFSAVGTYWFDKLSILHLYSVKTAYDEALGELAISLLPWTLVLHLAFSTWMYGNTELMKATTIDLVWALRTLGLGSVVDEYGADDPEKLYAGLLKRASQVDMLGQYGFVVKIVRSNVMLIFLFFVGAVLGLLLSTMWRTLIGPVLRRLLTLFVNVCCGWMHADADDEGDQSSHSSHSLHASPTTPTTAQTVVIPEFTDWFRKSVKPRFQPDTGLGFQKTADGELIRVWLHDHEQNGHVRKAGERMRTWEALHAPVKSYAIEMNPKYRLAVSEIEAASHVLRQSAQSGKVVPNVMESCASTYNVSRTNNPVVRLETVEMTISQDITATEPVGGAESAESATGGEVVPPSISDADSAISTTTAVTAVTEKPASLFF